MAIEKKSMQRQLLPMPKNDFDTRENDMSPDAIGFRLGMIRRAYKLKKSEIADLLEIDRPHWSRFENGQRPIPFEKADRIAQRFGVSLDFIFCGRIRGVEFDSVEKMRSAFNEPDEDLE